jgi:2-C-methyl-D-erythritol 4-phosphate cytidylyltransferase
MIAAALIAAAGQGHRLGAGIEKQFLQIGTKPLLAHTLARFEATPTVDEIIVVVPPGREAFCWAEVVKVEGFRKISHIIAGADTRQGSVAAGFRHISEDVDVVVVHDAARPFVTPSLIQATIAMAAAVGSAVAAVPESDTLKRVAADHTVVETLDRRQLWRAQTPQAFRRSILQEALLHAARFQAEATDEACLVESLHYPVQIIPGSTWNFKVTSPDDLLLAELLLTRESLWGKSAHTHLEER